MDVENRDKNNGIFDARCDGLLCVYLEPVLESLVQHS